MRAALCYGAALVVIGGPRQNKLMRHPTDTMKAYRQIPVQWIENVLDGIPYDCVPVAVDLLPDAESIRTFKHPRRAYYVFGAEDATLGKRITDHCPHKIYVPTVGCMNLAATVNVILYDRQSKERQP